MHTPGSSDALQVGLLSHYTMEFSDHCTLIVDFNTNTLLSQAINIAKPKTRLLTSLWENQCTSIALSLTED
jgi:hypothetical protein